MGSIVHEGAEDQYADGEAAKIWATYVINKEERKKSYKDFLVDLLKKNGCKRVLDVACGTGIDSVMLLEEGFEVVSSDLSDHMLEAAFKTKNLRENEEAFKKSSKFQ